MEIYDDMQHFFYSILQNCLDVYAPLRLSSKKSRRPTPWMTPSLLIAIKDKKQAKRKVEMSHNSNDIVVYKQIKNRLKILVREAKLTYLQTLLLDTKKDPSSAAQQWAGINNIIYRDNSNHRSTIDNTATIFKLC